MIDIQSYNGKTHNLPLQSTPFIGRKSEIGELVELLHNPSCRLLTLVGAGGIGKTRLALEIANCLTGAFQHGITYVPLAPLNMAEDIVSMMIATLGISIDDTGTPSEQLITYLSQRHLLLIIDNFEHLLDGTTSISDILREAPSVKIIVTSRAVLNVQEEWVRRIKGLPFPKQVAVDHVKKYDALQLFFDRATRLQDHFSTQDRLNAIRICQLVEGMPLAIELAASWLKSLTSTEIVIEIQRSIDFLTSNISNIPQQHRSIQAVFEHSWNLCTTEEQRVFRRLCVFRGGFTRSAAENVTEATLHTLSALVEKSMVRKLPSGRYDMQKLLQQYAAKKLKTIDQVAATQSAHMNYYAGFLQERTHDIKGRRQLASLNEIEADFENIRAAWNLAIVHADYLALDQMMEALGLYCDMHARYVEGHDLLKKAVDELTPDNTTQVNPVWNRLRVRWIQAWVLPESKVIPDIIRQQLNESLTLAKQQDDRETVGLCLWLQGELERISLNFVEAQPICEQAITYYEHLDNDYYIGRILRSFAFSLIYDEITSKDYARKMNQRHIQITRCIGDRSGLAHALLYDTAFVDSEAASQGLQEAIDIWYEMGDWKSVGIMYSILSQNTLLNGQFDESQQMAIKAEHLQESIGWQHGKIETTVQIGLNAVFRGDMETGQQLRYRDVAQLAKICGGEDKLELFTGLAYVTLALLNKRQSEQYVISALELVREPFMTLGAAGCLPAIAILLSETGQKEYAVQLLGLAFTYSDHYLMGWMTEWEHLTRLRTQLQEELGEDTYIVLWERGTQLEFDETINDLLEYFSDYRTPNPSSQSIIELLTKRELEVLALLPNTYKEIADKLTIVEGTVKSHTSNIYAKLGVKGKTQAVLKAQQLGLL